MLVVLEMVPVELVYRKSQSIQDFGRHTYVCHGGATVSDDNQPSARHPGMLRCGCHSGRVRHQCPARVGQPHPREEALPQLPQGGGQPFCGSGRLRAGPTVRGGHNDAGAKVVDAQPRLSQAHASTQTPRLRFEMLHLSKHGGRAAGTGSCLDLSWCGLRVGLLRWHHKRDADECCDWLRSRQNSTQRCRAPHTSLIHICHAASAAGTHWLQLSTHTNVVRSWERRNEKRGAIPMCGYVWYTQKQSALPSISCVMWQCRSSVATTAVCGPTRHLTAASSAPSASFSLSATRAPCKHSSTPSTGPLCSASFNGSRIRRARKSQQSAVRRPLGKHHAPARGTISAPPSHSNKASMKPAAATRQWRYALVAAAAAQQQQQQGKTCEAASSEICCYSLTAQLCAPAASQLQYLVAAEHAVGLPVGSGCRDCG
jgi:hypothetical protein